MAKTRVAPANTLVSGLEGEGFVVTSIDGAVLGTHEDAAIPLTLTDAEIRVLCEGLISLDENLRYEEDLSDEQKAEQTALILDVHDKLRAAERAAYTAINAGGSTHGSKERGS